MPAEVALKKALEMTGTAPRRAVWEALRAVPTVVARRGFPGHIVRFDEGDRRLDTGLLVIPCRHDVPVTAYPQDVALTGPQWPN